MPPCIRGDATIRGMLFEEVEACFPDAERIGAEVETANGKAIAFHRTLGAE